MLTVLDGVYPADTVRWTRLLLGLAGLASAWDAFFALHHAADGVGIRTFRSLPRLDDGRAVAVVALLFVGSSLLILFDRAPRLGALALALTTAGTMLGEQQSYSNHWVLLTATAALFALVPRPDGHGTVPYWPVFLLRVQVTSVYLFTAIAKLNSSYFTGRPLKWGTVAIIEENVPEKIFVVLSAMLLALELFLAVGLWVSRLRRFAIPLGILMHVSIALTGAGPVELIPFQLVSLSMYPLFLADPFVRDVGHDREHPEATRRL